MTAQRYYIHIERQGRLTVLSDEDLIMKFNEAKQKNVKTPSISILAWKTGSVDLSKIIAVIRE